MGLEIKRNKKDQYQIKSTISDEIIHNDNWVSESDAKLTLIERSYWKFMEDTVRIYMDFPTAYSINGKRSKISGNFNTWYLSIYCNYDELYKEYLRIKEELGLVL